MATIYHQLGIKAPLNDVYKAIATAEGVTGWWTNTSGNPETGGNLEFSFDGHTVTATVTGNIADKYIEWTVGGNDGEWLGKSI